MMRFLTLISLAVLLFSCSPNLYTIKGKCVDPTAEGKVTLIVRGENNRIDTVAKSSIINGRFIITGSVPSVTEGYLLINDRMKDYIPVLLENKNYKMVIDGNVVLSLTGTKEQNILDKYIRTRIDQARILEEFRARPLDERRNDSIKKIYQKLDNQIVPKAKKEQSEILEKYPDSYASAFFHTLDMKSIPLDELKSQYDKLTGAGRDNPSAERISDRIELLQSVEKGAIAPDFSMSTPAGDTLSLHSIPAKVKIIDFWASWCYPCRKENPFMLNLYEKYHKKGLEIIGISLDDDYTKWTNAIKKDGLTWPQVSELKKWRCTAVQLYDVKMVPHTVILNSKNEIVAINVKGEELEKLILKILNSK
ncbi:MAG: TlpA disulfide reductase family protein [Bacteroidales bacterium]|nr:TlpA disulfide reductase family protein [Bacteroidales bacterium]